MKRCSCCRLTKPLDAFGVNRSKPDGKQSECRNCINSRARELREKAPLLPEQCKDPSWEEIRQYVTRGVMEIARIPVTSPIGGRE
jgi:hypothetical protein